MNKSAATRYVVAFATIVFSAAHLGATVILPSLPAGTQYQIIFATQGGHNGTSADITVYNSFVSMWANNNATLAGLGVQWNAVASTVAVSANVNAPSTGYVFNTAGQMVASPDHPLYSGSLLQTVAFDQDGTRDGGQRPVTFTPQILTGSDGFGNGAPNQQLGGTVPTGSMIQYRDGQVSALDAAWLCGTTTNLPLSMYALSSPITVVVPEPATLVLLGSAVSLVGGFRLLSDVGRFSTNGRFRRFVLMICWLRFMLVRADIEGVALPSSLSSQSRPNTCARFVFDEGDECVIGSRLLALCHLLVSF